MAGTVYGLHLGALGKQRISNMQASPTSKAAPLQLKNRGDYVKHILMMKTYDQDYARDALKQYDKLLPELELMAGVREALK